MLTVPKCNFHTHTCFSDGANTPEEIVLEALRQGLTALGFSDHSFTPFDTHPCPSQENIDLVRSEVLRLKELYRDRIYIFCGLEQDVHSAQPTEAYDYLIGSVHHVFKDGVFYSVDRSKDVFLNNVKEGFGGDFYRFASAYFEEVVGIVEKTKCQIVGHFDLVEKFNEGNALYSTNDYRYRRPMIDALDELLKQDVVFEINTGAMARGNRTTPYPSPYVLRRIAEKRGIVVLNSDAHRKENLTYAFSDAVQYARSCGIGGLAILGDRGWEIQSLKTR